MEIEMVGRKKIPRKKAVEVRQDLTHSAPSQRLNLRLRTDLYYWVKDYVIRLGPSWTVTRLITEHLEKLKAEDDKERSGDDGEGVIADRVRQL
jgi:hypothetical protein